MPSLSKKPATRELQEQFCQSLSRNSDAETQQSITKYITGTDKLSAQRRLEIYQGTGEYAHINTLLHIYPVCVMIIGKKAFVQIARQYANAVPSTSVDLNCYGGMFPEFMQKYSSEIAQDGSYDYLEDLARLEFLWHAAYYQEDDTTFDFDKFQKHLHEPHKIVMTVSHSLALLVSEYPILDIWEQHTMEGETSNVQARKSIDYLCISRERFKPIVTRIDTPAYELLANCQQGKSMQVITDDDTSNHLQNLLPDMIKRGWVTGFSISNA